MILAGTLCFWCVNGALAATLCVNPGGGPCFPTIQGAVNAAAMGDTGYRQTVRQTVRFLIEL